MSKFLGPIHFKQYNKVKNQNIIVEEILNLNEEMSWNSDLRAKVDFEFDKLSDKPLEEIIDEKDIHGWISARIDLVESKLAFVVSKILRGNDSREEVILERIKTLAWGLDLKENLSIMDVFQVINEMFLEGMPCDRTNEILESNEDRLIWERKTDIHSRYWIYGYGSSPYYRIKDAFIRALVEKKNIVYEKINDSTYCLKSPM